MRTVFIFAAVLSLFLSGAFFAGSGFNAVVEGDHSTGELNERVQSGANESSLNTSRLEGSRRGDNEGSIVGMVVSSAGQIATFVGMMLVLPLTLQNIGFPGWFAMPIGVVIEIIGGVGLIQFVTGRTWR